MEGNMLTEKVNKESFAFLKVSDQINKMAGLNLPFIVYYPVL
ncbi:hypothetical protein [Thermosipho ferrireducens]|nr:hypothetical protein [Thermosipho ferrireducens]